jgi:hypothetical protein
MVRRKKKQNRRKSTTKKRAEVSNLSTLQKRYSFREVLLVQTNVKCRACNQLGHLQKVCKNKANQQGQQAQVVEHYQ